MRAACWLASLLLAGLIGPAAAQTTVYRCTASNGAVSYQDAPCPQHSRQHTLRLAKPPPASPLPATPARTPPASPPATSIETRPPPRPPPTPPPQLYACVRATDGKTYVSRSGHHRPYLAPSGILSFGESLSDAYGAQGGGGVSAPELNRGKVTPGMIGGSYVWVQDQCRAMSFDEVCTELQREYDATEAKRRNAFRSDLAPLERREAELQQQMQACHD